MWQGMHPSVLAAIASAEAQIKASNIARQARETVEPEVAGIRAGATTGAAELQKQASVYGAETQQNIELMKILSQMGGEFAGGRLLSHDGFDDDGNPINPVYAQRGDFGIGTIEKTGLTQQDQAALQAAIEMGGTFGTKQEDTGETEMVQQTDANGNPIPELNSNGTAKLNPDGTPVYKMKEVPVMKDVDRYDFGEGKIAKETASQKELAQQQLEAQLGLEKPKLDKDGNPVLDSKGNPVMESEYGEGTIAKTAAEQRATEKAQVEAQLGTGAFQKFDKDGQAIEGGGTIAAQSKAAMEQAAAAAEDTAALRLGTGKWTGKDAAGNAVEAGMGDYASLGEIASQGIEQRLGIQEQAKQDRDTMDHRQKLLNTQQEKIAGLLSNVNNPIMNMFGMGSAGQIQQPPAQDDGGSGEVDAKDAQSGLNAKNPMNEMFANAGLGAPQTESMNFLQSGSNPFDVSGMAGGMANAGGGANRAVQANMGIPGGAADGASLLALQGGFDARTALDPAASSMFAETGMQAGGNIQNQFNQQMANKFAMQAPFAQTAGQMGGAVAGTYGQSIANLAQIG